VYQARDTRLNRTVAIKVLLQQLSGNPDLRARFEREKRFYRLSREGKQILTALFEEPNGIDTAIRRIRQKEKDRNDAA
jgi:serine/threonine protein kinase